METRAKTRRFAKAAVVVTIKRRGEAGVPVDGGEEAAGMMMLMMRVGWG